MRMRDKPTNEQLLRRLRRPPESDRDPRVKNDAYWALRHQGHPHSYAIRAYRDQKPIIREHVATADVGEYTCEPDELLFEPGSTWSEVEVAVRPQLTEQIIPQLEARSSEYTVWDGKVAGLGVRVRPSGHKSYIVYYRVRFEKKLRKITLGGVKEFALPTARDRALEIRGQARMGNDPVRQMQAANRSN